LKPPTSISSPIQLLARTQVLSMVLKPVELCLAVNCTYAIMSLVLLLNIYIYMYIPYDIPYYWTMDSFTSKFHCMSYSHCIPSLLFI
jgi:hypothetical protein